MSKLSLLVMVGLFAVAQGCSTTSGPDTTATGGSKGGTSTTAQGGSSSGGRRSRSPTYRKKPKRWRD